MDKSGNFSTDYTLQQYVKYLVELRVRARRALNEGDEEKFQDFFAELWGEYFEKFKDRKSVDRPEWAEKEKAGIIVPRDVREINSERREALFHQVCKLQEKLEHTKIERPEWEEKGI